MLFRELETDRLRLKNIYGDDQEFMLSHFSGPEVNRFLFDREPLASLEEANEIIQFYLQPEPREQHRWILVRKEDGIKIGTCGFHCWNRTKKTCELGYDLQPHAWGKGYMSEALQAILWFAKNDMKVLQVEACIYPKNEGSVRLAESLGFVFGGKTLTDSFRGKPYEHRIYALDFAVKEEPVI